MRGAVGLTTVLQKQQSLSKVSSQTCANYAMCPPHVIVLFQSSASHQFHYVGICYGIYFLLSGFHVAAMLTNGGSTVGVCTTATLQSIPMVGTCASWCWSMAHARSAPSYCSFHCFEYGQLHASHSVVVQPSHQYGGVYSLWSLAESCRSLYLPYMIGRGLFFKFLYHAMAQLTTKL